MFLLVKKETWTGNTKTKRNMDRQYNDQKKHGQTIQRPKGFFWSLYCLFMFLLVVVLPVHVSFGRCIVCPYFFWSLYCLSMFLKKHGQAIQRPKKTWTGNTTTKGNMDRQYNDQKKHGLLLVVVLSVHASFGRCIACPCFLWSLYCLSMFLLVVVLSDRQYKDQKKHGQAIQRPKETWTDNTTTKRNMDRQYNDQHVSFGGCIVCPCFFW
jgi:hypothetical protein